jgi:hypothetical protein
MEWGGFWQCRQKEKAFFGWFTDSWGFGRRKRFKWGGENAEGCLKAFFLNTFFHLTAAIDCFLFSSFRDFLDICAFALFNEFDLLIKKKKKKKKRRERKKANQTSIIWKLLLSISKN